MHSTLSIRFDCLTSTYAAFQPVCVSSSGVNTIAGAESPPRDSFNQCTGVSGLGLLRSLFRIQPLRYRFPVIWPEASRIHSLNGLDQTTAFILHVSR